MKKVLGDVALLAARAEAQYVANEYLRENGEHPFNCGFAWVVVKGVRGNKAKLLKEYGFKPRIVGGGLQLWNPADSMTQDMSVKMAGAEAYAKELRECGLDAEAYCRLD